ncbi:BTAD domain-containing putative transcriptional regulator [Catellatospora vulcania]|uniref:BTAD domain-containing putative transcriptional regulator n=1 Tax=Catellatospora vulcania TaxID=1460450 RepID=UPI0018B00560|nr:BTAD domain-containing putative transcriptional regulator [Catellatospora vulcania]
MTVEGGHGPTAGPVVPDGLVFSLLGPLEVRLGDVPVPLRGLHQRAVLGKLLLHANAVVATSDLIRALWSEEPPATARKMLQNAIAAARGVTELGADDVVLATRTPGYLLQAPPERIDRWRFHQLAAAGRDLLAAAEWARAAEVLGQALALWRGPVLSDLAEAGIAWPELAAEQNARLAALEDHAAALLALGRHHEVITRLEAAQGGGAQPPRERLAGNLMLALYRAGRQADALSVYRRTRTQLIEQLGLDPSRQLQDLERAILAHDAVLLAVPAAGPASPAVAVPARMPAAGPAAPAGQPEFRRRARPAGLHLAAATEADPPPMAERKPVTVLLLRAGMADSGQEHDPEDLQEAWQVLDETVESVVGLFGGSVRREVVGSLWTAWFGVPRTRDDDAERAVQAARELLRRLDPAEQPGSAPRLAVRVAVASGDAVVSRPAEGAGPAEVHGGVLDTSLLLLGAAVAGQVRVCDTTRAVTRHAFAFAPLDGLAGWAVQGPALATDEPCLPLFGRADELRLLSCMLGDVARQRRAHLATVLGEPGIGKTGLVAEFCRRAAAADPEFPGAVQARCAVVQVGTLGGERLSAVLEELGRTLEAGPSRPVFGRCEDAAAHRLALVDDGAAAATGVDRLVERFADAAPLVVVFEDVHRAEGRLLDYIEDLVGRSVSLPLLVVVTARAELLERRPYWGGGTAAATVLTLDPLPDDAVRDLLAVLGEGPSGADPVVLPADLPARVGGVPRFAVEYVRQLRADAARPGADGAAAADGGTALPSTVHRLVAARLDALPAAEKALLQDAAVLGEVVCTVGVAAVSGRDPGEVAHRLRALEAREFLRRAPGRPVTDTFGQIYLFRHVVVREVAYGQLPRGARADKHHRAATWLQEGSGGSPELAARHCDAAGAVRRRPGPAVGRAARGAGVPRDSRTETEQTAA